MWVECGLDASSAGPTGSCTHGLPACLTVQEMLAATQASQTDASPSPSQTRPLLDGAEEPRELQRRLTSAQRQVEGLQAALDQAAAATKAREAELEAARGREGSLLDELAQWKDAAAAAERERSALARRLESATSHGGLLDDSLAAARRECSELSTRLAQAEVMQREASERLRGAEEEARGMAATRAAVAAAEQAADEARRECAALWQRCVDGESQRQQLEGALLLAQEEAGRLRARCQAFEREAAAAGRAGGSNGTPSCATSFPAGSRQRSSLESAADARHPLGHPAHPDCRSAGLSPSPYSWQPLTAGVADAGTAPPSSWEPAEALRPLHAANNTDAGARVSLRWDLNGEEWPHAHGACHAAAASPLLYQPQSGAAPAHGGYEAAAPCCVSTSVQGLEREELRCDSSPQGDATPRSQRQLQQLRARLPPASTPIDDLGGTMARLEVSAASPFGTDHTLAQLLEATQVRESSLPPLCIRRWRCFCSARASAGSVASPNPKHQWSRLWKSSSWSSMARKMGWRRHWPSCRCTQPGVRWPSAGGARGSRHG